MITRLLQTTFALLLLLSPALVNAHTNEVNQAELKLLVENNYQLSIDIDVLHVIKSHQKSSVDETDLINHLKNLSLIETKQLLSKILQIINQQSAFIIDEESVLVAPFSGLTVFELKARLRANSPTKTIKLLSQGQLPQKSNNAALIFSPILGDVLLTVSRSEKSLVLSGQNSHHFSIDDIKGGVRKLSTAEIKLLNIVEYIYQGFVHILPQGLDHILFVLALFLLATKTSTLLWQVSAFTLAHTITLALGIFGIINLPSSIVEPLIALSIAYVAIENIFYHKLTKWRLSIIFAFGLLHGLGFAAVLVELGLPKSEYVSSLISFNIGVELGQITVVALALLATRWFAKKPQYRQYVVIPLSALIAVIAIYWFIERTF
ncbi:MULTISPECIES: HupE/UreJ family protein [unclassified Colwellia]|uniref:HupE/UreJ family protein n=1 Tax=unclassified Colwellia TaxID=196834 RepID=UPI0015F5935A|nr:MULTISPECIES: HupE/UreJ family protein [unclassified Colwellia]MBA6232431.1 HupE/UreJ family protein [Colwellia sp. MB02u-7]MBA6238288.1 HupE/UreJ family protein [Colwellia sp. MB02u-11]MBA6254538.1 HupE/UreJ family protein [Colwellia sp. MB3u-28]MBA6258291.1 HupE/UreJ family protein [Colwellia sp. MB3u-41]MBA6301038.1 HupE/UreJ family protein [Colwellia sp. MB3u-22]